MLEFLERRHLEFLQACGLRTARIDVVFGFPGSDPSLPLFAFVFLVALGVDYNIFLVARAREEGWCKRPIILVPNTIVWKWKKEIADVLPDYRVVVIGSKLKRITRGPKKGQMSSDIDTREERAMKWRLLQQGLCDVALVTYSMFSRLGVKRESVEAWIDSTPAIQRDLCLKARNAEDATRRSQQSIEDAEEAVRPLFRQRAGIVAELKAAGSAARPAAAGGSSFLDPNA